MAVVSEEQAMARALLLARRGPPGENPRVGCVILDRAGEVVGEGWHEGAGTAHAETVALAAAGSRASGGTAVTTLEPCAHHGRTAPCTDALINSVVSRVVYGHRDPNPIAAGGANVLTAAGLDVSDLRNPSLSALAGELVERWAVALRLGRPFVTWKFAATLDGRSAARDGSSRWVTGAAARADVHRLRAEHDTVLVGTGTVLADDPRLTVRDEIGVDAARQPRLAVMGLRDLPPNARVLAAGAGAPSLILRTRDPGLALAELWGLGSRQVLLEGGPTLAAAFLQVGSVDEVVAYVAPALLGAGVPAVADLGVDSIDDAWRFDLVDASVVGDDVRMTMRPRAVSSGGNAKHG